MFFYQSILCHKKMLCSAKVDLDLWCVGNLPYCVYGEDDS